MNAISLAGIVAVTLVAASSLFLFVYGLNLLYLSWSALRIRPLATRSPGIRPARVAVQLPMYNERYVADRVIDAVAALDWPRAWLEVQVLDDSDDETVEIVARAVRRWRDRGLNIVHLRRSARTGFKAGALAHGLELTSAEFLAVFDADFVPPSDFLRRTMPAFADATLGFVQARWGYLNEDYSFFTSLQALMTDFHFLVEQAVRARSGYLTNFTGSAGVWRRRAIEAAGGWRAVTLTEDLDLSYRAQLAGWKAKYLEEVCVPQELPVSVDAYRSQQARWATGSFQCALRLLGPTLSSPLSLWVKFQATMHLLGYAAPLMMLLQIAAYPLLLALPTSGRLGRGISLPLAVSLLSLSPIIGLAIAQRRRGRPWWRHLGGLLAWSLVGAGTSLTVAHSLLRAFRRSGEFTRTPKYRIEKPGQDWGHSAYFRPRDARALGELVAGGASLLVAFLSFQRELWLLVLYASMFGFGFLALSLGSGVQALRIPAAVSRRALHLILLLAAAGLPLLLMAQLPDPFEDSYQHWLLAATLASTGRLQDPLFHMQDTWLPAFQVIAAALLKVFGLWQLAPLKAFNIGASILSLGLVYRLAGGRRRGVFAVLLLAVNPIFLLTSSTVVAEPLLLAALLGAVVAVREGRTALAAALMCLACLTGTKAWLWLGALVVVIAVARIAWERIRLPSRLGWIVPALALVLILQGTQAFASNSLLRAALEANSAATRGSIPLPTLSRAVEFIAYLAWASLPIAVFAPFGFRQFWKSDPSLTRLLIAPSLLYLAAVTALVGVGAYSGSHRYYYPALPGLAILAAAALDRASAKLQLGALVASAGIALYFIPIFLALSAENAGLVAAGAAAARVPGTLLTDSPVVAYWSRKPVTGIYGSESLPTDHALAVAWLRDKRVGALALENISYYRASAVFPALAAGGAASPPFFRIGAEDAFAVAGGKPVHVYAFGRPEVGLTPQIGATLGTGSWPEEGKTAPLAKGLVLQGGAGEMAGEGLGLGLPIVHFKDGWWFPGPDSSLTVRGSTWVKSFDLDRRELDDEQGRFRSFQTTPSRGRITVTYTPQAGAIEVLVKPTSLTAGASQFVILNEESAAFDDYADAGGQASGAAIGSWVPVVSDWARFRSGPLAVEWAVPAPPSAGFFRARELRAPGLDLSGLEYQFGPGFQGIDYQITVRRAR